ncbi:MAG: hypothetical protein E4H21_10855 [Thermodesulfobacteriales bacterium]|nr:MAG: hypothetical protein E4H21_10855 [Thermodesulfobacteriales bacterium]
MRKLFMLVFLTLWLLWASGPAVTGPLALRNISKSPLMHIMTGIVTGFVIYISVIEDILRGIVLIVGGSIRGP